MMTLGIPTVTWIAALDRCGQPQPLDERIVCAGSSCVPQLVEVHCAAGM
jgi:hypothetical protein